MKLSDLLGEGKTNVNLYPDDPEKQKHHARYRTPRHRLVTPKGIAYERPLSGDPALDLKYNMVALEFLSNGLEQTKAYAAVFGCSKRYAKKQASALFNSTWFRGKLSLAMMGADGKLADTPKEYLLQKLFNILEMNILDYIGDDGTWLSVPELRKLPLELQQMLDDFSVVNTIRPISLRDVNGEVAMIDGAPYMVELREQKVHLKLPDRLKSMELLAKLMQWIATHTDHTFMFIDASTMQDAEARIAKYRREDIESTAKRITSD